MSMSDPIADMLTRIRNAQKARKETVALPHSKVKLAIAGVLEQEGYISAVAVDGEGAAKHIKLTLKYHGNEPVIARIRRVSRPGLRVYASVDDLPKVQGGLGISVVSTSAGVMSDREARAQGRGGEVLCIVY
jgi:small subunit ribosomal protein S8